MKVELILGDEYIIDGQKCLIFPTMYDIGIRVCIDDTNNLSNFMEKPQGLKEAVQEAIWLILNGPEDLIDEKEIANLEAIAQNPYLAIKNIEYITLSFDNIDPKEYIKNNPYLLTKKIALNEGLYITDFEKAKTILDKYYDIKDNIYVVLENNMGYIKIEEAYKTIYQIKTLAEQIKGLNLSPFETVMYTYDIVRKRVYKSENEGDSCLESRNLSSVLTGDKIVCVGYANIFSALLKYMGYECDEFSLYNKSKDEGHRRNIAYLKDSKYNIDGFYTFDATFDSRREDDNNIYLKTYPYFAKTIYQMKKLDKGNITYDSRFYLPENVLSIAKEIIENGDYCDLLDYYKALNHYYYILYNDSIIDKIMLMENFPIYGEFDKEEFLNKIEIIFSKLNQEISAETYIKALTEVRKQEYYQDPQNYSYTTNDLYQTCYRSKWNFSRQYFTPEEKLLYVIFGENGDHSMKEDFRAFIREEEIPKEIEEVKLTKVLSLINKNRK